MFIIIPDIHGDYLSLKKILEAINCYKKGSKFISNYKIIFLGDLIDTGKYNKKVIELIRELIEQNIAECIMGNHEYNAIQIRKKISDRFCRIRNENNLSQHQTFINEFGLDTSEAMEITNWFKKLPLFIEYDHLFCVHAYPGLRELDLIKKYTNNGVLKDFEDIYKNEVLKENVEMILKGPEQELPNGNFFYDYKNQRRTKVRIKWWANDPKCIHDIIVSVRDKKFIDNTILDDKYKTLLLKKSEKSVFFGHYKLNKIVNTNNFIGLDVPNRKKFSLVTKNKEIKHFII